MLSLRGSRSYSYESTNMENMYVLSGQICGVSSSQLTCHCKRVSDIFPQASRDHLLAGAGSFSTSFLAVIALLLITNSHEEVHVEVCVMNLLVMMYHS